jgi:hypothetical protein
MPWGRHLSRLTIRETTNFSKLMRYINQQLEN